MALAAVAHDRNDAVLDDGQIGIGVVEQLGHGDSFRGWAGEKGIGGWVMGCRAPQAVRSAGRRLRSLMERPPRLVAITPDLTSSLMP